MTIPFLRLAEACGATLTPAQRVLVKVVFDGLEPSDLDGEERELAAELFGPIQDISEGARRVFVAVVGARSGKSYLSALRLLHLAVTVPLRGLAPGEVASAPFVAPDIRLAKQGLRYALGAVRTVPELADSIVAEEAGSFVIRRDDGHEVTLECLPATAGGRATRGRSLVGAVMDESAFFRDQNSVVNDQDIFKSIKPRLVPGGQLLVVSTPWAEAGLLYELHKANFGKPAEALVAHAPTPLMRPDRPDLWIGDESDETWRVEFGAEFLSGGADLFFDPASLDACAGLKVAS